MADTHTQLATSLKGIGQLIISLAATLGATTAFLYASPRGGLSEAPEATVALAYGLSGLAFLLAATGLTTIVNAAAEPKPTGRHLPE